MTLVEIAVRARQCGVEFEGISDPARGLALSIAHPYEVVVLDWRMPELTGAVFLEALLDEHPLQRIVVFSNEDPRDLKRELSRYPTVAFVPKERGVGELIELLGRLIEDKA